MSESGHAEAILAKLEAARCMKCGGPPVTGARICLACASRLTTGDLISELADLGAPPESRPADRAS